MKVLFVINSYFTKGNGLCASARRTVKKLKDAGVHVRVLSTFNHDSHGEQPHYMLSEYHLPIFDSVVTKQGYMFAKKDKATIKRAVEWADVIHLEEPFGLQMYVAKLAKKLNKPCTSTYHLHPENLFASVYLSRSKFINGFTMWMWKRMVFNKCQIVQCPTQNVKERLQHAKYKAQLRVISNGLVMEDLMHLDPNRVVEKSPDEPKYTVITIGRFSVEKDIKTLLTAMKYSKHANDIQLIIAGRGPKEKSLKKRAQKLMKAGYIKNEPQFGFYPLNELQDIAAKADLYVHCAFIEVEGLSCMEAIQIGLVPIIADGKYTATSQFALDKMSIFKGRDPKDLAEKIDYWLDNDELRNKERKKYIGLGKEYAIESSITELISMFEDAIEMKKI